MSQRHVGVKARGIRAEAAGDKNAAAPGRPGTGGRGGGRSCAEFALYQRQPTTNGIVS